MMIEKTLKPVCRYIGLCIIGTLMSVANIPSAHADICFLPDNSCYLKDGDSCDTSCNCEGSHCCPRPDCGEVSPSSTCAGNIVSNPEEGKDCNLMEDGMYCCYSDACTRDGYTTPRSEWEDRLDQGLAICEFCPSNPNWLRNCYEYGDKCEEAGYHLITADELAMLNEGSGECEKCVDTLFRPLSEQYVNDCIDYDTKCRDEQYTLTEEEKNTQESQGYTCEVCPDRSGLYKCTEEVSCEDVEVVSCSETQECKEFVEGCGCVECQDKTCQSYGYQDTQTCDDGKTATKVNDSKLGSLICYECVDDSAKTCSDYGYQETQTCDEGKTATKVNDSKLGSLTCYKCVDDSAKTCSDYGYQETKTCPDGKKYENVNDSRLGSLTCYKCVKMTCSDYGYYSSQNEANECPCGSYIYSVKITENKFMSCYTCSSCGGSSGGDDDGSGSGEGYSVEVYSGSGEGYSVDVYSGDNVYSGGDDSQSENCDGVDCTPVQCTKSHVSNLADGTKGYVCEMSGFNDRRQYHCCTCGGQNSTNPTCPEHARKK